MMKFATWSSVCSALLLAPAIAQQIAPAAAIPLECAFPANPNVITEHQPDGTPVQLHLRGDGRHHWYEDLDGFAVLQVQDLFVYARTNAQGELRPTQRIVGTDDPAAAGIPRQVHPTPRLSLARADTGSVKSTDERHVPGAAFRSGTGSVDNLVILLQFSNHGPSGQNRTLPTTRAVTTVMNTVGGHPTLAPTGSVRDHYLEDSYGQFTIDSTVAGWFIAPGSESYYADGSSGLTSLTWDLIVAGLDAADASVDFSNFDQDGDGWIDAITFLHSGYGAEWGGTDTYGTDYSDRMWSHKWTISPPWTSAEGVKVAEYNISPGLWGTSGSDPGRIGVVVHELGHFFGMPDLYDTTGGGQGIGNWCVMASGSWGFDGSQQYPSHMNAWAKSKIGWLFPQIINPGAHSAPQVETNDTVFMIDSGYPPGEYLLVENRQPTLFDSALPQGGLAIWHVDDSKGSMGFNNPNTEEGYPGQGGWPANNNHYRVAMMQADDDWDLEEGNNRGDSGDLYHSSGVTSFTGSSSPSSDSYQGGTLVDNANRITAIGPSGANVSFNYANATLPTITTTGTTTAPVDAPFSQVLTGSGGTGGYSWTERIVGPLYDHAQDSSSLFANVGVAQGWQADDATWALNLPFAFPFYGDAFTTVYVSSNGFIALHPGDPEPYNQATHQRVNVRISPLWDDLATDGAGEDIYVDTSVSGQVTVRWDASTLGGGDPCNFSVVLHQDGGIDFHYGSGNTGVSPTIGISRGQGGDMIAPLNYDGATSLTNADSYHFTLQGSQLPPGLTLATDGTLSGTATQTGTWTPLFKLTDGEYNYDAEALTIEVILDCNGNLVDDALDIAMGLRRDCNTNGIPDDCETNPCAGLIDNIKPFKRP